MTAHVSPIPRAARPFQGRPAGLVSRFLAAGIDLVVVIGVLVVIYAGWATFRFLLHPAAFHFPSPSRVFGVGLGFIVVTLYLTAAWTTTGRTYGDQVMAIRVVTNRGNLLRPPRALLRALLCAVFPLGLFWVAVSRQNKSLQDIVLHTSVVYDWRSVDTPKTPEPLRADRRAVRIPRQKVAGLGDKGTL